LTVATLDGVCLVSSVRCACVCLSMCVVTNSSKSSHDYRTTLGTRVILALSCQQPICLDVKT